MDSREQARLETLRSGRTATSMAPNSFLSAQQLRNLQLSILIRVVLFEEFRLRQRH